MNMKKAAALLLSLSVLAGALVLPLATASTLDEASSGQVLSHAGDGDPLYTTQSYSGNLKVSASLRFDEAGEKTAELRLHRDGDSYYAVALSQAGVWAGRVTAGTADAGVQAACAFETGAWYALETRVVDGTLMVAVGGKTVAVYQDPAEPLDSGAVGFSGTAAYSLDDVSVQELLGPQVLFSDSFGEGAQDGADYTVPLDPVKDYTLEFTMNTAEYTAENWGRGAEVTLREGVSLRFMNDALALTGVETDWVYNYADLLKTENYLQTDRRMQIRLHGNSLQVSVDGALVYAYTGAGLDKAPSAIKFTAQDSRWTLDDLRITAGAGKQAVLYEKAEASSAPFSIPNTAGDYTLAFDMKVDSYDNNEWGRAARVTLRNGVTLHFMKDALAVEGLSGDYQYSYVDQAKLGNYLGQTVPVRIDVQGGAMAVWVSGVTVFSYSGGALADKASCNIDFGSWDATWSASNIRMTAPVQTAVSASFDPPVDATGYMVEQFLWPDYTLDFNMNIASFDDEGWGRAARVILRDGTTVHFMKDALALEGESGGYVYGYDDAVKMGNHLNTDTAVKMVVQGNSLTVYMNGVGAYEYTGSALDKAEAPLSFDSWDATWTLSSVAASALARTYAFYDFEGDTPLEGLTESAAFQVKPAAQPSESTDTTTTDTTVTETTDTTSTTESGTTTGQTPLPEGVLYYNDFGGEGYTGMNPAEGTEAVAFVTDKAYGPDYVLETTLKINSIGAEGGRGIKFVLRASTAATSGDMELWIGSKAIWACTNEWKNMQDFDITPYLGKEVAVKITVKGGTIALSLDGKEVWSAEDATFAASTVSKIQLGGWDAQYIIDEVKISALSEKPVTTSTDGSSADSTTTKDPLPEGVLYYTDFGGKPYEGMNAPAGTESTAFVTDKAYGPDYVLESTLKINAISDGDGRGVKFVLRACKEATSGDMELWIGKKAIWACTNEWKNMQDFDITPYLGKEVAVKITVKGGAIALSLDGKEVWSAEDATFAASTVSKIQLGGWDAQYLIKEVKISDIKDGGAKPSPDTGVAAPVLLAVLLVAAGAGSLLLLGTRRARKTGSEL